MYRSSRWNAAPMQLDKENENRVFVSNVWGARESFEPKEMEVDVVPVKSDIIEKTVPQPMIIDSEPKENTSALFTTKIFDAKASQAKRLVPFTAHPSDYSNHDRYWSYFKELPQVFSQWIHFLYTTSYILLVLYIMFQMVNGIYSDYQLKLQWFQNEILLENQRCSKNFQLNKCDPETRVPAVEDVCQAWEHCMLRDPLKVASTKITASVFAEILEEFVQNVSYKSIFFIGWLVMLLVAIGRFLPNSSVRKAFEPKPSKMPPGSPRKFHTYRRIEYEDDSDNDND